LILITQNSIKSNDINYEQDVRKYGTSGRDEIQLDNYNHIIWCTCFANISSWGNYYYSSSTNPYNNNSKSN